MPRLENKDYEKLATEIANDFINNKVPLTESVYKKASELGLAPDQITQLAWQANTKTHLELFDKKAEDKIVDFPVADPKEAARRIYASEDEKKKILAEPIKNDTASILKDFMSDFDKKEKEGEKHASAVEDTMEVRPINYSREILNLRKVAQELEIKAYEAYESYRSKVASLRHEVRMFQDVPDYGQLEFDAIGQYGESAKPILEDLKLTNFHKHAAFKPSLMVDVTKPLFKKFAALKEDFDAAVKYTKGLRLLKERAGKFL